MYKKIPSAEEWYVKTKLFMYMNLQCLEFFMQTKKMFDLNLGLEMLCSYLNKEHLPLYDLDVYSISLR